MLSDQERGPSMVKSPRVREQQWGRLEASVKEMHAECVGEGAIDVGEAGNFGLG